MNAGIKQLNTMEKFLLGSLSEERCALFLQSLQSNPEQQEQLNNESSFEAAFFSQQWLESPLSGKDGLAEWFPVIAPPGLIEKEQVIEEAMVSNGLLFTYDKWR